MPNKAAPIVSKRGTRTRMEQLIVEVDKVISRQKPSVKASKKSKKK